ncbi:MAG: hypothetical protein EPN98_21680 [Phenylobacterium sp.]|uniref:hypothetical protein n=1 Tax=Phenylobacterium sp. TaxID=1871053 RepID=UPI001210ECC9|nr:hypothetical protein [Phenylobacterium sp.]TAL29056.1 MAG: hypothetical protein EPN98_21680 [Phenylobacterium sp.]
MPLDSVDRDLLMDLLGRSSLTVVLETMADIYDQGIDGKEWVDCAAARGIVYDVIDTVAPVVARARAELSRRVKDGAGLARDMGL